MTGVNEWVGGLDVIVELGLSLYFSGPEAEASAANKRKGSHPLSCVATLIGQLNLASTITNSTRKAQSGLVMASKRQ